MSKADFEDEQIGQPNSGNRLCVDILEDPFGVMDILDGLMERGTGDSEIYRLF